MLDYSYSSTYQMTLAEHSDTLLTNIFPKLTMVLNTDFVTAGEKADDPRKVRSDFTNLF